MENNETTGQKTLRVPSESEWAFMRDVAFPQLDIVKEEQTLEHMADSYWNLCMWEKQRADILDTKASYLLGLSSIASAIVAVFNLTPSSNTGILSALRIVVLVLFVLTVASSIVALFVKNYGGFLDSDTFNALSAYKAPVGKLPQFTDKDPHRCYLRETILQRWLVYRWYSERNDRKYMWLKVSQAFALVAVLSLLGPAISTLSCP